MSHVGNGENDFDGLDDLNLPEDIKENLRQAKIEAREIIDRLEPFHISSWADLLMILDNAREDAYRNAEIYSPIHKEMAEKKRKEELKVKQFKKLEGQWIKTFFWQALLLFMVYEGIYFFGLMPLNKDLIISKTSIPIGIIGCSMLISYVRAFFLSRRIKSGELVFEI